MGSETRFKSAKGEATLSLKGTYRISEAAEVHATALKALNSKATHLHLDFAETTSLDLATLQVILSLKKAFESSGRSVSYHGISESLQPTFNRVVAA